MIRLNDGRVIRARRNGFAHLSPRRRHRGEQHTIDVNAPSELAEALQNGGSIRVSTNAGRVLALRGIHLGDAERA